MNFSESVYLKFLVIESLRKETSMLKEMKSFVEDIECAENKKDTQVSDVVKKIKDTYKREIAEHYKRERELQEEREWRNSNYSKDLPSPRECKSYKEWEELYCEARRKFKEDKEYREKNNR